MSIPAFLEQILNKEYGKECFERILNGYSIKRLTTFRVNTLKSNVEEIKKVLDSLKIKYSNVSWYEDAFVLEEDYPICNLDIYKEGKIYVQSLSSMIPALIVSPQEKENILDMCAAPGSKTTQMAALSCNKAMITACEKNKIRFERLKYNLEKQGATRVGLIAKDARYLDNFFSFDKIMLDSPCSGSGTININDKDLSNVFTEELITRSVKTQLELIKKAVKILKKDGELIYSTCSILKEENEQIIEKALKLGGLEIVPIDKSRFTDIRFLPTKLKGTICIMPTNLYEGFFVAKLKKI